jgi:hypothetical protein
MPHLAHQVGAQSQSISAASRERWSGVIGCIFVAGFLAALGWFKLGDVDAGYHIAYGQHFLTTGHIVDRDPFIFPENAQTFVNANWGSQVIMALAWRAGGAHALVALRSVLLICIFASIALIAWRVSRSAHAIAWACLLAGLAGYERFSMRPELFSYALLTAQLAILAGGRCSRLNMIVLIAAQLLWVNLHSYFLVGIFITLAMLLGMLASAGVGSTRVSRTDQKLRVRFLGVVLICQMLVCFINPWHWRGATFPLRTLKFLQEQDVVSGGPAEAPRSAWGEISEFRPPFQFLNEPINNRTIHAYLIVLSVAILGAIALLAVGRHGEFLVVLGLVLMSLQMRRNIAQFAFVAAPLSMGAILAFAGAKLQSLRGPARLASIVVVALLAIYCVQTIYTGYFYFTEKRINREFGADFSDATYPRPATEWISSQTALKPGLFVDYFSSSNALLWLPERFKICVDTNTFAYPEPVLRTVFDLGLGKTSHEKFFNDGGINVAMLHAGPDTQMLIRSLAADTANWALVYVDPYVVVFIRRIPEHASIIAANLPTPANTSVDAWADSATGGRYHQAQTICSMANVPISLSWYRSVVVLIDQVLRRTHEYSQAWYISSLAHANLGKAAGRKRDFAELKIQYKVAQDYAAKAIALDPDNTAARQIYEDMKKHLSMLSSM